jgi:hypothetical protein
VFVSLREGGFDRADKIEARAKAALIRAVVCEDENGKEREQSFAALLNVLSRSGRVCEASRMLREKCVEIVLEWFKTNESIINLTSRFAGLIERVNVVNEMISSLSAPTKVFLFLFFIIYFLFYLFYLLILFIYLFVCLFLFIYY